MLAFLICKPCTVDYSELVLMRDCLWPYFSIDKNANPGQYPREGENDDYEICQGYSHHGYPCRSNRLVNLPS